MAIVTTDIGVPPGEGEAGLAVVHGFPVGLPTNQWKVRAIMFGMAAHTVFASHLRGQPNGMHSAPLRDAITNLRVTLQTL